MVTGASADSVRQLYELSELFPFHEVVLDDPALVREHLDGRADHRKPLWTLLAFLQWWRSFRE